MSMICDITNSLDASLGPVFSHTRVTGGNLKPPVHKTGLYKETGAS